MGSEAGPVRVPAESPCIFPFPFLILGKYQSLLREKELEEVRAMPGLILWKDQEIDKLRKDMDRLIGRFWDDFGQWASPREFMARGPAIHLSETDDTLLVQAEVPGIDPADLDVSIAEGVLTIKGSVQEEVVIEEAGFGTRERRTGYFSRSLQLPCKVLVDEVQATFKDDLLKIVLPKCKEEATRRVRIRIQ